MHTSLHAEKAEQPHAKNWTVAENCTETLHHVFCTFEAEEFIYLVLFFILLRTKQQQVTWQKYSCLIMFENLIKKYAKIFWLQLLSSYFISDKVTQTNFLNQHRALPV